MSLIRVYSPFFPLLPDGGAPQVIHDQARTLAVLGYPVELVYWKGREDGSPGSINPRVRVVAARAARPGLPERQWQRGLRVLGSLASEMSSPERYYYPRSVQLPGLEPAELGIYHYSFAYSWLSQPRARLEKRRVVYFHNLESEAFEQRGAREARLWSWVQRLNCAKLRRHEAGLAGLADELWFISPADLEKFRGEHPGVPTDRLRLVPPTYPIEVRHRRARRFLEARPEAKTVLGFVGSMDFGPNARSAQWIVDELAPRLRQASFDGEILIAGKGAPPELVARAAACPFVRFLGFVPDLEAFWASLSYALVPHLDGSGTRIKLLEALASGVPALASTEAARRIHPGLRASRLLFLSDHAGEWVARVLSQPPQQERRAGQDEPFPRGLDGAEIYRFLAFP